MWYSHDGFRQTTPVEAAYLKVAIGKLADELQLAIEFEDMNFGAGVEAFDCLQPTQQVAMLHQVSRSLLIPDCPPPEITSTLEATVYAIFLELQAGIDGEIDRYHKDELADESSDLFEDESESEPEPGAEVWFRQRTWDGFVARGESLDEELQDFSPFSDDAETWEWIVECLADDFLMSRDFELESTVADQRPQEAAPLKAYLGIGPDYFTAIAPDLSPREAFEAIASIRNLISQP